MSGNRFDHEGSPELINTTPPSRLPILHWLKYGVNIAIVLGLLVAVTQTLVSIWQARVANMQASIADNQRLIMKDQTELMRQQTKLLEEQGRSAAAQTQAAQAQAESAKLQLRLMQRQGKKAEELDKLQHTAYMTLGDSSARLIEYYPDTRVFAIQATIELNNSGSTPAMIRTTDPTVSMTAVTCSATVVTWEPFSPEVPISARTDSAIEGPTKLFIGPGQKTTMSRVCSFTHPGVKEHQYVYFRYAPEIEVADVYGRVNKFRVCADGSIAFKVPPAPTEPNFRLTECH